MVFDAQDKYPTLVILPIAPLVTTLLCCPDKFEWNSSADRAFHNIVHCFLTHEAELQLRSFEERGLNLNAQEVEIEEVQSNVAPTVETQTSLKRKA